MRSGEARTGMKCMFKTDMIKVHIALFILLLCLLLTGCSSMSGGNSLGNEDATVSVNGSKDKEGDRKEKKNGEEDSAITWPLVIKAGYSTSRDDPRGIALESMKEKVESETGGRILIEIHPDGELGSDNQLIEGLYKREVDMTVSSAGNYALYAPRIGVSALPFLFDDFESAWAFIDSDTMHDLCGDLEPYNMHVLAFFDNGFRCVTTKDRKVESAKDMKDLNIRTPDNQIVMETMSELGARPRSYPFSELKEALTAGVFDAQENPIPVIYNSSLYEVQKYLSITNHSYDAMPLTIRQDIWDRLPSEYQGILETAALEAQTTDREMVARQTEDYVYLLKKKGMVITRPDLREFASATEGVLDVFSNVYGKELTETIAGLR